MADEPNNGSDLTAYELEKMLIEEMDRNRELRLENAKLKKNIGILNAIINKMDK
jgi:regulator of replication initiation timing